MELQPDPSRSELSQVTFENYREYMELRAFTFQAFSNWFFGSLHVRKPMQFPYTEAISNSRLERDAKRLRKDAQYVFDHGHPNAMEINSFRTGLAESIEAQIS